MAALGVVAVVIILLLSVSALFSAAETALTGVSRARMHQLERDGDKKAGHVNRLIENQETMIGSVLLGNNVINILSRGGLRPCIQNRNLQRLIWPVRTALP